MSGRLNKKIARRIFLWVIFILLTVIVIVHLIHDVDLDAEVVKLAVSEVPEIRVENIEFERDISGVPWKISIPSLEKQDDVMKILSIDVSRELDNGDIWKITGNDGEYAEKSETAAFHEVSGHVIVDGQVFNIHAPWVLWEKSGDLMIFSKGITVNGDYTTLSADKAKIESGNMMIVDEGGEIIWNLTSYDMKN